MLLLGDYACHKTVELEESFKEANTMRVMMPPHYTSVVQLCDVGINRPLKDRLKKRAAGWRQEKHKTITPGDKLPSPKRADVLEWLSQIWEQFPSEIVKNAFTGSGYVYEEGIDYSGETESDSDAE